MKLHLPKALVTALTAVYAAAAPLATTVGTGAVVAAASTLTARAEEHTGVSGEVTYTGGDSYTLSGDTTFTGIPAGGDAATVNAGEFNVTLQTNAADTQVGNFPTLNNVANLNLADGGRYKIGANGKFSGVSGTITIGGAQVWFTDNAAYTEGNRVTQDVVISAPKYRESGQTALDKAAMRISRDVEIGGVLTINSVDAGEAKAKIAFESNRTLTLSKGMAGEGTLILAVFGNSNDSNLVITGSTANYTGVLEFGGNMTVKAGSKNGLHVGGIVSTTNFAGALGLADGTTSATLTLDVAENQSHSFAGSIAAGYSIVKTGAGTQTFTNTANILSGDISVKGGTLVYDGSLLNTDNVTLTGESTLTLGGTVNITSKINNDAGTLVLKDGVVLKGLAGGINVTEGESFTYIGAASITYGTEIDLTALATSTANIKKQGTVARDFSDVVFESGSTLVIGDEQTVTSKPTIKPNETAGQDTLITVKVGDNNTATWQSGAQVTGTDGTRDDATATNKVVGTISIGAGATLNVENVIGPGCSYDTRWGVFTFKQTINLGKGATLNSKTSLAGWKKEEGATTVVTMGAGSTWNIQPNIADACEYMNQTTINMDNATIDIAANKSLRLEREYSNSTNSINTTNAAAGMSKITGAGKITLHNADLTFGIGHSEKNDGGGFDYDTDNTADLRVETIIDGSHSINKTGKGILEFTAANTYTGSTNIGEGTLRLSDIAGKAGTGTITVAAGSTLELAHTANCTITNSSIVLNGHLLLSTNVRETLSGTITGTLQSVTLSDGARLGLSGSGASMSIGLSKLTMGKDSGFYLANNARLTLGENSDGDRVEKMEVRVRGDGTGELHFNMLNSWEWGTHKVIVLHKESNVGGVYIDSGCLAMSSSELFSNADAVSTNLRGTDLHLADGANLVVTKKDGGNGNMGTVYLAGTTKVYSYSAVNDFTFTNNFTKEGTGTAVLEKTDGGAITLSGNVSLDEVKLTEGTLKLEGDLSLSGAMTATKGTLTVSGGNIIGGGLTIGNHSDAGQSADVVFESHATINNGITVDRGTLVFKDGAALNGTLDISNGGNAVGHVVVSGGTVTNNGTIWSKGADNYIELQGGGKFTHENLEYSVRSGLSEESHTRLYTTANEWISISLGESAQKTVISNASINVLGTEGLTITAELSDVDITNQAGGGITFAGKDKTIRNLLDYTGHAMSNSASLTVTGTLSLSGTLTLTGAGRLVFDAANLVLDHGMSGFDTLSGTTSEYSQGANGYIRGNSFVIINASANVGNLHINGEFAEGSRLSLVDGKVICTVTSENANTYYINEDCGYSSVVWKEGGDDHLVWVTDGHTLTLDRDFDSAHRLATAYEGWVALGDGVTVTNFGQTPADVDNIKVKTGEHATISGAMTAIEPINTLLASASGLTVEAGEHADALNFGKLTLSEGSTLSTARDISATLVSAAGGTVDVGADATAVFNLDNASINMGMSGAGTIELHNDSREFIDFTSAGNDFSGTLKVVVSNRYIKFGNNTQGGMQTFAASATPDLVLEGGDGVHGIIILNSYAGTDADPTANAMHIGSLASDSDKVTIRGDMGPTGGHRYIEVVQGAATTFAGLFHNDTDRSVGLVMNGTGNLTLTNANQSTAGLYINTGTVTLGGDKGAWAGAIKVAKGATLAYDGPDKVLENTQDITFTGASTLKVEKDATLTLKKAVTADAASLSIADGGKLILGNGGSWSGKYVGGGNSTIVIGKTGNTQIGGSTAWADFTGTLDVAMGSVYVGAPGNVNSGADATLGATNVVVRRGASFITHFGQDGTNGTSAFKEFGAAVYTESGATIGNRDGHAKWTGKIHLNMLEGLTPGDTIRYSDTGITTFNLHWDKEVTWNNYIYGSGTLNITTGATSNPRRLILGKYQNQEGAFNGTYRLSGITSNWTELRLDNMWAAKGAKVDLHGGQVRLVVNTQDPSVIAGLSGNTGEVYAANANRSLTIEQSDDSIFAGVIKNNGNHTLSVTKENAGNLNLTGANTSTGALSVNAGTVTLGGDNGAWAGNINIGADGTLAYAGADKTLSQGGTIANGAHINTLESITLTLTKNITSAPIFNIAKGTTLKITGGGDVSASQFAGAGTLLFDAGESATRAIGSQGNTFTGTLEIASGTFRLGAAENNNGRDKSVDFSASKVLVRRGATFQTNNGEGNAPSSYDGAADDGAADNGAKASISSTFYAASGSSLKNLDGHSKWSGTIHLNVADLGNTDTPVYDANGEMTMNMYWAKHVVWDAVVKGNGTLKIEGENEDGNNTHRLVLNNNDNTFQGTYSLKGNGNVLTELYLNKDNAAKHATIDIDGKQEGNTGKVNLLVGADNAAIAGLKGSASGTVKADGGARTLIIDQSSDTDFAGSIADGTTTTYKLGITKQNTGTLTLSGTGNTYTGSTTVSGGTLKVTGRIGNTSSAEVSGNGVLEISGENASVTAGGITATAKGESGTAKNVTVNESGITGATSGEGDTLKALGEMTSMTLAFAAENTAAEIRNVTLRDVTITNGAVSMSGVKAFASSVAAQAEAAPALMMARSVAAQTSDATDTKVLTATPVKSDGSVSGDLTVDLDASVLRAHAGETISWTIFSNVSLEDGGSFTLELGDVLKTIVENRLPEVTLSGDWVGNTEHSLVLTSENLGKLSTGNLLAAPVNGGGNLVLTVTNIPEPAGGTLSVLALAALAARRRRK